MDEEDLEFAAWWPIIVVVALLLMIVVGWGIAEKVNTELVQYEIKCAQGNQSACVKWTAVQVAMRNSSSG